MASGRRGVPVSVYDVPEGIEWRDAGIPLDARTLGKSPETDRVNCPGAWAAARERRRQRRRIQSKCRRAETDSP